MIPEIRIEDYNYPLPEERIAKYPLPRRDESKLLRYKNGKIDEYVFRDIVSLIPDNALMIFNDTKVVPARLHFQRSTGAHIEIFCLRPEIPADYAEAFGSREKCVWKCVVGNVKRWKDDVLHLYNAEALEGAEKLNLKARLVKREEETSLIEFSWDGGEIFSNVLDICGKVPIPPYLNRDTEAIDLERYQTTYAHIKGSVAAPTAGLHFTELELDALRAKGVDTRNVCLHVGAGTFLPVKSSLVSEHPMHREPFVVSRSLLLRIIENLESGHPLAAVGTTSVRTLESLYYAGVSCIENGAPEEIRQWAPYDREYTYSTVESLRAIVAYLDRNGLDEFEETTRIIIVPGFKFRLVDTIVTNFHQPESTLILLVSAFVNGDWRRIYDYALGNGFRFLSYGDSSILFR